jgi:hypothetical protein
MEANKGGGTPTSSPTRFPPHRSPSQQDSRVLAAENACTLLQPRGEDQKWILGVENGC